MLEERRKNRAAVERSARRNLIEERKRAHERLAAALVQLENAWAEKPLSASLLRSSPELRGPLRQELGRLGNDRLRQWLSVEGAALLHSELAPLGGSNPFEQPLTGGDGGAALDWATVARAGALTGSEISQLCASAEVRYHRGGEMDFAASMAVRERWRLHNALKESCKQLTVSELEVRSQTKPRSRHQAPARRCSRLLHPKDSLHVLPHPPPAHFPRSHPGAL